MFLLSFERSAPAQSAGQKSRAPQSWAGKLRSPSWRIRLCLQVRSRSLLESELGCFAKLTNPRPRWQKPWGSSKAGLLGSMFLLLQSHGWGTYVDGSKPKSGQAAEVVRKMRFGNGHAVRVVHILRKTNVNSWSSDGRADANTRTNSHLHWLNYEGVPALRPAPEATGFLKGRRYH